MSELKVLVGDERSGTEILAAGTMFLLRGGAYTFSHGGESVTVRPTLEVPPRAQNGNFFIPLPAGTLLPGAEAFHPIGGAEVFVQLRQLARHPTYIGAPEFLFSYEVTRRAAEIQARAA